MSAKSNVSQGAPQGVAAPQGGNSAVQGPQPPMSGGFNPAMGVTSMPQTSSGQQSWDTATSYGGGFNPAMGVTPIDSISPNQGYQPSTGWSNGQPAQFDAQRQQMESNAAAPQPGQPPQPRDSGLMNTYSSFSGPQVGMQQGRPGQQAGTCPTCGR